MRTITLERRNQKKKFGTAEFSKIIDAYYQTEEDMFCIRFENGIVQTLSNKELKKRNQLKTSADVRNVTIDSELGAGFFVEYRDGKEAEASWEMVLEENI